MNHQALFSRKTTLNGGRGEELVIKKSINFHGQIFKSTRTVFTVVSAAGDCFLTDGARQHKL